MYEQTIIMQLFANTMCGVISVPVDVREGKYMYLIISVIIY